MNLPCILAGTSEKGCCANCGAPWERVVEKPIPPKEVRTKTKECNDKFVGTGFNLDNIKYGSGQKLQNWLNENPAKTIGWQPTCTCPGLDGDSPGSDCADMDNWPTIPCTVLDPFFGSGTVFRVAYKHGRRTVGIELSKTYLDDIAIPKIEKLRKQRKLF